MDLELLQRATAFIWQEADMLDHGDYDAWLSQWTDDGLYIVPIDPRATDFANTLNYAYDDADMRGKRVARLRGGKSISSNPLPRTVRSVSRFRILQDDGAAVRVRCAQILSEFRKDELKQYTADVDYDLLRSDAGFVIRRKLVRLINSTDTLRGIGYIL
ncbi:MAG TPA: aromatic-ring-hydroxylating dioxygenase subunit beta [Ramlibacter sp.]|nr:aromatic-ring-hydroxylating dioxygenase subunit beta [Ramlibacter sp.]